MYNNNFKSFKLDPLAGIILTLLTCGIYNLIWQYRQIQTLNALLEKEEFSFSKWFLLSILTCGIYHLYHEYLMAKAIYEVQEKYNLKIKTPNLPTLSLILSIFGLTIIVDAIEQKELNIIIDSIFANEI